MVIVRRICAEIAAVSRQPYAGGGSKFRYQVTARLPIDLTHFLQKSQRGLSTNSARTFVQFFQKKLIDLILAKKLSPISIWN